jgi:hypothetical protein
MRNYPVCRGACVAILAVLLAWLPGAPRGAGSEPVNSAPAGEKWDVHTGFDPARHGWELPNLGSDYLAETKGQSPGGECYGMARMAQVMFDPTKKDQPGLYDETRKMEPLKRFAYAVKAQHELQSSALELMNKDTPDHASTLEQAKRDMKATGKPQVVVLHTGSRDPLEVGVMGPKHAVLLTGFRTEGGQTIFDMYDPNAPSLGGSHGEKRGFHGGNCLMGKTMRLVYNQQQKAFFITADGKLPLRPA